MKKILLFTIILFSCFIFTNQAKADTPISGNITENTTWTLANSPYIVTGTIQVLEDVTLTIEPGVEIKFNQDAGLNIDGALIAIGTASDMITFTSNELIPQPGDWNNIIFYENAIGSVFDENGNYISGSAFKYCQIEYSGPPPPTFSSVHAGRKTLYIDHSIFENINESAISIAGPNSQITNNIFRNVNGDNDGVINVYSGNQYIANNIIENNTLAGIVVNDSFGSIIEGNILNSNIEGIRLDSASSIKINNNTIKDNLNSGINYASGQNRGNIILNNNIINNKYGIYLPNYEIDGLSIKNNNIYDNIKYDLYYFKEIDRVSDINAKNNYWGTTDTSEIDDKIYDYYDDVSLGKVFYEPYTEEDTNQNLEKEPVSNSNENNNNIDTNLSNRLKGKLLLQVNQGGRIWYVNPDDSKRFEVTFANALPLFENFALGITDNDLDDIPEHSDSWTSAIGNRLKGKLLLQVEQGGRIWYVDFDGKRWEVTWANLMELFESLALGITDDDLFKIDDGEL